jgi:WD40 repeat protein
MRFSWRWLLSFGFMGLFVAVCLLQPALLVNSASNPPSYQAQSVNPGTFNPSGKFALVKTLDDSEQGHISRVNDLAISPDGKVLISASRDKTIKLWNLETASLITTLSQDAKEIYSVAISPDGQTLASGSADETIKIWRLNLSQLAVNSEIPVASL